MKLTHALITATMLAGIFAAPSFAATGEAKEQEKIQAESSALSPDKAKAYNDAMQAAADKNKDLRVQIKKAHEEADAILTAPKFDKKAWLDKAAELDKLYGQTRANMNDAFVTVASSLSQDERKLLLKARNDNRRK